MIDFPKAAQEKLFSTTPFITILSEDENKNNFDRKWLNMLSPPIKSKEMIVSEKFLSGKRLAQFEALQHCLVPRSRNFSHTQKQESIRLINDFLDKTPLSVQRKLALFFIVIDIFSLLFGGKTFKNSSPQKQIAIMNLFFDSPLGLFRKGFWGLNTLIKLGVFGQPSLYADIGYAKKEIDNHV